MILLIIESLYSARLHPLYAAYDIIKIFIGNCVAKKCPILEFHEQSPIFLKFPLLMLKNEIQQM